MSYICQAQAILEDHRIESDFTNQFGSSIDAFDDYFIFGSPNMTDSSAFGRVTLSKIVDEEIINLIESFSPNNAVNAGKSCALSEDYAIFSYRFTDNDFHNRIYIYDINDPTNSVTFAGNLVPLNIESIAVTGSIGYVLFGNSKLFKLDCSASLLAYDSVLDLEQEEYNLKRVASHNDNVIVADHSEEFVRVLCHASPDSIVLVDLAPFQPFDCEGESLNTLDFGFSVDINENYAVVGAPSCTSIYYSEQGCETIENSGAVFLFEKIESLGEINWIQKDIIYHPFPDPEDKFGWKVKLDREYLYVSAIGDDSNGANMQNNYLSNSGSIYQFKIDNEGSEFVNHIKSGGLDQAPGFGDEMAVSDNLLFARSDYLVDDSINGAVHLFEVCSAQTQFFEMDGASITDEKYCLGSHLLSYTDGDLTNFSFESPILNSDLDSGELIFEIEEIPSTFNGLLKGEIDLITHSLFGNSYQSCDTKLDVSFLVKDSIRVDNIDWYLGLNNSLIVDTTNANHFSFGYKLNDTYHQIDSIANFNVVQIDHQYLTTDLFIDASKYSDLGCPYRLEIEDMRLRSDQGINVYPNPCNSFCYLKSDLNKIDSIELFDQLGNNVNLDITVISDREVRFNTTKLNKGTYYLRYKLFQESEKTKIIVKE